MKRACAYVFPCAAQVIYYILVCVFAFWGLFSNIAAEKTAERFADAERLCAHEAYLTFAEYVGAIDEAGSAACADSALSRYELFSGNGPYDSLHELLALCDGGAAAWNTLFLLGEDVLSQEADIALSAYEASAKALLETADFGEKGAAEELTSGGEGDAEGCCMPMLSEREAHKIACAAAGVGAQLKLFYEGDETYTFGCKNVIIEVSKASGEVCRFCKFSE